jgi:hypothetical protein
MGKRFQVVGIPACLVVTAAMLGSVAAPAAAQPHPLAFVQAPRSSSPINTDLGRSILASRYSSGMRIVAAEFGNVARTLRVLTEGFVTATDPRFRHDGSSLIFVGHRAADTPLEVWEFDTLYGKPSRRVSIDMDCVNPIYLPGGGIGFASLLGREYEEHGGVYSFSLFAQNQGSEIPTRLSFNPSSDFDPLVLPDGRVLYSSWQHVGNHYWPQGTMALMLINADGTGVFPATGNHRGPWLKRGAKVIGKTGGTDEIAFITAENVTEFGAGSLMVTSLNDPFASYRTLVPADQYAVADLAPLPDGRLLMSARPSNQPSTTFGLYIYNEGEITTFYDDPEFHELLPTIGAPQSSPERRISTVVAGTSYGYIAILDCQETDRTDQHALKPGAVRSVRVIEGRPVTYREGQVTFLSPPGREGEPLVHSASATGYIPSRILGEIPPASDGSVYLKVPADRPLRIQLIDEEGFAAKNERAWFWVRPNERRVCIGCHENRELSPPNRAPLATRREPTDLTDPTLWRTVTFRDDIMPIVKKTCATTDCHIPPYPTAAMNLTPDHLSGRKNSPLADRFGPAYANLLARFENKPMSIGGRRVHPGDARSSPLLWMLYGRALAKQYAAAPFGRPMVEAHPGPMLPAAQLELFRTWVDLGAPYDDGAAPGSWPHDIPNDETIALEHKPDGRSDE